MEGIRRKSKSSVQCPVKKEKEGAKREIIKKKKVAGEPHVNHVGLPKSGAVPGPDCRCKRLQCYKKITLQQQQQIFQNFYEYKTKNEQDAYLSSLISFQNVKQKRPRIARDDEQHSHQHEFSYYYKVLIDGSHEEVPVCATALMNLHGITRGRLRTIQSKIPNGEIPKDLRGKHDTRPHKVPDELLELIKWHIKSFVAKQSHHTILDKSDVIYLPKGLNVSKMHQLFLLELQININYGIYYQTFKSYFSIKFGIPSSNSSSIYDRLILKLKCSSTNEEKDELIAQKKLHRQKAIKNQDKENTPKGECMMLSCDYSQMKCFNKSVPCLSKNTTNLIDDSGPIHQCVQLSDNLKPSFENMAYSNKQNNSSNVHVTEDKEIKSEIEVTPTSIQYVNRETEINIETPRNIQNNSAVSNFIVDKEIVIKTETIDTEINITPSTVQGLNDTTERNTRNQSQAFHNEITCNGNPNFEVKKEFELKTEMNDFEMDSTLTNLQTVIQETEIIAPGITQNNTPDVLSQYTLSHNQHFKLNDKLKTEITVFDIEMTSDLTDFEVQATPTPIEFVSNETEMILPDKVNMSLESRNEENSEKVYECQKCGVRFLSHKNYEMHMQCHVAIPDNGPSSSSSSSSSFHHMCTMCGVMFPTEQGFIMHSQVHDELNAISRKSASSVVNVEAETYDVKVNEIEHNSENTKQREQTSVENTENDNSSLETPLKPNKFNKKICDVEFKSGASLKTTFIEFASSERPYRCGLCDKRFTNNKLLSKHEKTHGEKRYKCHLCNTRVATSYGLTRHLYRHASERPYQCKLCDKGFTEKCNLKAHERDHTEETPYKCIICSKAYRTTKLLNRHKKTHENRCFECNVCLKRFATITHVKRHLKNVHNV